MIAAMVAIIAAIAAFVLVRSSSDDGEGVPAARESPTAESRTLESAPSEYARARLKPGLIDLYIQKGAQAGIDWAVIAATDQLWFGARSAPDAERVAGIAISLESFGAPADYAGALERQGLDPGSVRKALRLADRFRDFGLGRVPVARSRLQVPTDGPVVASFGQRFGILHDGIDFGAEIGDPVRAAAAGLVLSTESHPVFGEYTCILHRLDNSPSGKEEITTCYGNQSRYEVKPDDVVEAGELIGRAGCTGACLKPHLHFQVKSGAGTSAPVINPASLLPDLPGAASQQIPLEGSG